MVQLEIHNKKECFMLINLEKWKEQKKKLHLTFDDLAEKTNISRRQLQYLFQGETENPRIDTVQAIERALGLAPTFTDEERALGLSENHPIALSDDDRELINLFAEAEEELGKTYVQAIKKMVRLQIDTKGKP